MKQALIIDNSEVQYVLESKNLRAVLGSGHIYRPVTFNDVLHIVYLGLLNNFGYSFDDFKVAFLKGLFYPSKRRGHFPLSVISLRIRSRVKDLNKNF